MAASQMRRNPLGALDPVQSRMWDWFATPLDHTPMSRLFGENTAAYVPPVDVYETREEVILAASLPGLDGDKLNIEVIDEQVLLSGEQNAMLCFEPEENAVQHLRGIPRLGRFSFALQLPCAVETEQAQAKYENGLLCMRFLKAQKHRPVRISLNVGSTPAAPQSIPSAQAEPTTIEASAPAAAPQP